MNIYHKADILLDRFDVDIQRLEADRDAALAAAASYKEKYLLLSDQHVREVEALEAHSELLQDLLAGRPSELATIEAETIERCAKIVEVTSGLGFRSGTVNVGSQCNDVLKARAEEIRAIANESAVVWTDKMLKENGRLAESIHGKMKERIAAAAQVTQHTGKSESSPTTPVAAAAHVTPIGKTPAQSLADQPCSASPTPLGQEIDNLRRQLAEERAAALSAAVAAQDAKRYRWLRDNNMVECPNCISSWKCNGPHITGGPEIDAAIDAAIAAGENL